MTTILFKKLKIVLKKYTKNFKISQKERGKNTRKKKSVLLSINQSTTHFVSHNSRKEKSMFPARKFTSN